MGKDDKNAKKRWKSSIIFIIGGIKAGLILIYEKRKFSLLECENRS